MNKTPLGRIQRIYGIALSVMIIAAGICFMAACLQIYNAGGDQPYTPETVAAAFSVIAIPVYTCLALLAGSVILHLLFPAENRKAKAEKQYGLILRLQHEKADMDTCNKELIRRIRAEQNRRCRNQWITIALMAAGSAVFLIYALNGSNFHPSQINESMVKAAWLLAACLVIPFGYAVFSAYDARKSIQKEIDLVKLAPRAVRPVPKTVTVENTSVLNIARWTLVCAAVAMVVYGFFAGGTTDVLTKAVNICTECVGLG